MDRDRHKALAPDPQRIEARAWLTERFGEVKVLGKALKLQRIRPNPEAREAARADMVQVFAATLKPK